LDCSHDYTATVRISMGTVVLVRRCCARCGAVLEQWHEPRAGAEGDEGDDLLPPALARQIPPLRATDGQGGDAVAWARLFAPGTSWSWYVTEYDGQDTCFGLVVGPEAELGYFSLQELRETGLVRRDRSFRPQPLRELPGCPEWLKGVR